MWRILLILVLTTGLAGVAFSTAAADEPGHGGKRMVKERRVSLDEIPEAVKATILEEADGQKIREIEEVTVDGKITYEAEWLVDGREFEIEVAPDGTLLNATAGDDEDDAEEAGGGDDDEDDDEEEAEG